MGTKCETTHGTVTSPSRRVEWSKSWDFLFAIIGSSVGLGNVWRFPYLCFKNGGGAFLVPYFIFAVVIAIPMVILETSIGQYVRRGIFQSWGIVPIFKGIAIAQGMFSIYSGVTYPIILVWATKYLVGSFSSPLPWSTCNNTWNTVNCSTPLALKNVTIGPVSNSSDLLQSNDSNTTMVSATTEYFGREVLHVSSGLEEPGTVVPDLALYLCLIWIVSYLCMFDGIKWTAKVIYFTATLPFILIFVILIRGVTLDGAGEGIYYYLVPDLVKLKDPEVWISAGTQVIFSYSVASPQLVTLASFNKRDYNFWRGSFVISALNTVVSLSSGFAVFSTLGYMAKYQNTTVDKVVKSGPGLAFIAYPETISLLPLPQLWSALFFCTILLLGIDTQFACLESLIALLVDNFRFLRNHTRIVRALVYTALMLIGLSMIDEGGVYTFEIFNNYGFAGWSLFFVVACESVAIGWLYGFDRYWDNIVDMIGDRRGKLWIKISWVFITPITCAVMVVYFLWNNKPLVYEDYVYPLWSQCVANLIAVSTVIGIPAFALYKVLMTWKGDRDFSKLRRKESASKLKKNEESSSSCEDYPDALETLMDNVQAVSVQ